MRFFILRNNLQKGDTQMKMFLKFNLLAAVISTVIGLNSQAQQRFENTRNTADYNLQNGVGLKGFDPVAIFPEGGGQPMMGKQQFKLDYMGVTYFFTSASNLDLFVNNPEKYEPTYGGWCAYAMASGSQVDIQPHLFTIHGNRAHYFVANRAKQNFDRDILGHENRADKFWKQISGENPRL